MENIVIVYAIIAIVGFLMWRKRVGSSPERGVNLLGEAMGQPGLPWTTDCTNPWSVYTSETINAKTYYPYDGKAGVKSSGAGGGEADSWLQTTITGFALVARAGNSIPVRRGGISPSIWTRPIEKK